MNTNTLPNVAAYKHPTSEDLIFIMKGSSGYWPKKSLGIVDDELTPEIWNEAHDVTAGEAAAMFHGSMFGWDVPAADPENWNADGTMKNKRLDD